jgi:hypothetical protein
VLVADRWFGGLVTGGAQPVAWSGLVPHDDHSVLLALDAKFACQHGRELEQHVVLLECQRAVRFKLAASEAGGVENGAGATVGAA